jgi:hypothetical protein
MQFSSFQVQLTSCSGTYYHPRKQHFITTDSKENDLIFNSNARELISELQDIAPERDPLIISAPDDCCLTDANYALIFSHFDKKKPFGHHMKHA